MTRTSYDSATQSRVDHAVAQVESHTMATVAAADGPNYWGIYASSIFAMTMLFLLGVGIPSAMVYGNAGGWGLGAFCAFWGGPGFGVMAGGARVSTWNEKHETEH